MKKTNHFVAVVSLLFLFIPSFALGAFPLTFTDSAGKTICLERQPRRVVSLVPGVTEILLTIGAGDAVVGITYHSILPPQAADKVITGGFFYPDTEKIAGINPDLIFYTDLQREVVSQFRGRCVLVNLSPRSIGDSFRHINLLGRIFGCQARAGEVVAEQKRLLDLIRRKTALIPREKRVRVMRLMGRGQVMTPGDDSFQKEYVEAAGGIAPDLGEKGAVVPVSLEEWQEFNPQVLYGCGGDRAILRLLHRPGWKNVDAVKNNRIYFFPCELTYRAAAHTGYFVAWLSSRLYRDEFSNPENFVLPEQVVGRKELSAGLPCVKKAEVVSADIKDFRNKAVVVHLSRPMKVVSTLEGMRENISVIGNNYFPPPAWGLGHRQGLDALRRDTMRVLGLDPASTSLLFTGANMDNLAVTTRRFKEMQVVALVTAGVSSNAVRMSADTGKFYELAGAGSQSGHSGSKPGTINILILTNLKLTERAMTRAIITATEAKSAALQDLDIRSSYTPLENQATGTGTDNIIVVQGGGPRVDSSGGHSRLGTLIARAVYQGVQEAVHMQNGFTGNRNVFQRLRERKIDLWQACMEAAGDRDEGTVLFQEVESLLLDPFYAGYLEALMAAGDAFQRGLVCDIASMSTWSHAVYKRIASGKGSGFRSLNIPFLSGLPPLVASGLSAIMAGAMYRMEHKGYTVPVSAITSPVKQGEQQ